MFLTIFTTKISTNNITLNIYWYQCAFEKGNGFCLYWSKEKIYQDFGDPEKLKYHAPRITRKKQM